MEAGFPVHTALLLTDAAGLSLTVTITSRVPEQIPTPDAVNVYVVVCVGLSVNVAPVNVCGPDVFVQFQVYVLPNPLAFNVTGWPLQIAVEEELTDKELNPLTAPIT